jgi:hypothetical protein
MASSLRENGHDFPSFPYLGGCRPGELTQSSSAMLYPPAGLFSAIPLVARQAKAMMPARVRVQPTP